MVAIRISGTKSFGEVSGALLAVVTFLPLVHSHEFDWFARIEPTSCSQATVPGRPGVVRVDHAGLTPGVMVDGPCAGAFYDAMASADLPLSAMLRNATAPLNGSRPHALQSVIDMLAVNDRMLDYVFSDFETGDLEQDRLEILEQVRLVRQFDPDLESTRVAAYPYFPGAVDPSQPFPESVDMADRDSFYHSSGLNVAMPEAYPYAYLANHAQPGIWLENVAPNTESALFWAPLEQVSVAARSIVNDESGDLLIPWVSGVFECGKGPHDCPEIPITHPTVDDVLHLVQHLRLRGADGYYLLALADSATSEYQNSDFQQDVYDAWHDLDPVFSVGAAKVLNLETDKTSGVQWSGVVGAEQFYFLFSNLGDSTVEIAFAAGTLTIETSPHSVPQVYAVPESTRIPEFTLTLRAEGARHAVASEPLSLVGDYDGDGNVDGQDFLTWQASPLASSQFAVGFAAWQANFGSFSVQSPVQLPEPGALPLVLLFKSSLLMIRSRRPTRCPPIGAAHR